MPDRREDLGSLRAEFVTGLYPSVRQTALAHGIAPSTLARQARKTDEQGMTWEDHRRAYLGRTADKAYDLLADQDAVQLAARQRRILRVADMVLDLFEKQRPAIEAQIDAGKMPIAVRDMVVVAELVRTVIGRPKDEIPKPGLSLLQVFGGNGAPANGVIPDNLLAQLESAARSKLADAGSGTGSARPDPETARPD